jgi:hypothetical protein
MGLVPLKEVAARLNGLILDINAWKNVVVDLFESEHDVIVQPGRDGMYYAYEDVYEADGLQIETMFFGEGMNEIMIQCPDYPADIPT